MKIKILLFIPLCMAFETSLGQLSHERLNQLVEDRIGFILSDLDENNTDYTQLYDILIECYNNPININTNGKLMETIGLISPIQYKNLKNYIKKNGPLINLAELQVIPSFDLEAINRIKPFVKLKGNEALKSSNQKIINDQALYIRIKNSLEKPKGYQSDGAYEGSKNKYYLRYSNKVSKKMKIGFTSENDPGEKIAFKKGQVGFDFLSYYLRLDLNQSKTKIIVGDYHVNYGQGLVNWNGRGASKSSSILQVKNVGEPIRQSASANETNYMRGLALEQTIKNDFTFSLFISRIKTDGTVNKIDKSIESISETGLHRTENEILKRKRVYRHDFGSELYYRNRHLKIGTSFASTTFNVNSSKNNFIKGNLRTSIYFESYFRNLYLFGESAFNPNGKSAQLMGLLLALSKSFSISIVGRNSNSGYSSQFGQLFSEGNKVSNEQGIYTSANFKLTNRLTISAYKDHFYFPKSRFQADGPTEGQDALIMMRYVVKKLIEVQFKSQVELKEKNQILTEQNHEIQSEVQTKQYQFQLIYFPNESFTLKTRIHMKFYNNLDIRQEEGLLIFQDVKYKPIGSKTAFYTRFAIFDTDSYNTRIYTYENDVLYSFSIPAYSGIGQRYYLMISHRFRRWLNIWVRFAQTIYNDRSEIGSGNDLINDNVKSDLTFQIRFNF